MSQRSRHVCWLSCHHKGFWCVQPRAWSSGSFDESSEKVGRRKTCSWPEAMAKQLLATWSRTNKMFAHIPTDPHPSPSLTVDDVMHGSSQRHQVVDTFCSYHWHAVKDKELWCTASCSSLRHVCSAPQHMGLSKRAHGNTQLASSLDRAGCCQYSYLSSDFAPIQSLPLTSLDQGGLYNLCMLL